MAYTNNDGVDEAIPDGSVDEADDLDDFIKDIKKAYNERLDDLFGFVTDTDDPLVPTKLGPKINIDDGLPYTSIVNSGNTGALLDIVWSDGDQQKVTLTANATLTFSAWHVGATLTLDILQDATGGRTLTLPTECKSGIGAFSTAQLNTSPSTLTTLYIRVYNASTFITTVSTTGSSVS